MAAIAAIIAAVAMASATDPVGDLISAHEAQSQAAKAVRAFKASLYHIGAPGVGHLDSLGCKVVPMRTAATDRGVIARRSILFIPETVGLPMPDGGVHDGYWYASDVGGAIKGARIDLFTGHGRESMRPFMRRGLNMALVSVAQVGRFEGCPRARPPQLASAAP